MSAQKQEDQESSIPRLAATTARFMPSNRSPHFFESYAFGYNPYATVHLRKQVHRPQHSDVSSQQRRSRINELANSPFKRISRVEHMIHQQKTQLEYEPEEGVKYNQSLRPHFKVRTSKHPQRHNPTNTHAEEGTKTLHLHNLSLECPIKVQPQSLIHSPQNDDKNSLGNNYQEIFKNRKKLNRKSPKKKLQASLLDMLNRISEGIPMQRYKSRAFEHSSKVSTFLHSS